MTLSPIPVESFGGLNLLDDPGTVGWSGAIDLLNIDSDQRGRVRSRDGFAKFTSAASLAAYHSLAPYYKTDGTRQLIAAFGGASGAINALNTSGAVVAAQSYASSAYVSVARFAAPGSEYAYVAASQATGAATVYRWDGATWTTPAWSGTAPTGRHIAAWQNRLVNARRAGTTNGDSVSTIRFSNITAGPPPAADPQTWNANDFVELSPGDGEEITGLIAWRDACFAFKESKFFVFYGTSTDSSGNVIFNYRPIHGQGLASAGGQSSYRAVAAAPDGVYFLNRRGIWFTNGGPPTLVSGAMDPIFRGTASAFYQGGVLNQAAINTVAMAWHDNRLYVAFPSGSSTTNDKLLVFDPQAGYWLLWSIPSSSLTTFRVSNVDELALAFSGGPITLNVPSSSAALSSTAGTLTSNQAYFYKVTALNAAGETTPSSEVSATARAALTAPSGVQANPDRPSSTNFFYYKIVAYNNEANSAATAEVSAQCDLSGAVGSGIGLIWTNRLGSTKYRIYRGTSAGAEDRYIEITANPAFVGQIFFSEYPTSATTSSSNNTGGANSWIAGSVPSATSYQSITVTWTAIPGATSYRVYRGTTSGGENVFYAPGNVVTYTDTNAASTGGSPPVSNTATTAGFDVGRYNVTSGYIADGGDGLTTGAAITSRYRSGFSDLGSQDMKVIREWRLQGIGSPTLSTSTDFGSLEAGAAVTLGTSPATAESRRRFAVRGRQFSFQIGATSAWSLNNLVANIREKRLPGTHNT